MQDCIKPLDFLWLTLTISPCQSCVPAAIIRDSVGETNVKKITTHGSGVAVK